VPIANCGPLLKLLQHWILQLIPNLTSAINSPAFTNAPPTFPAGAHVLLVICTGVRCGRLLQVPLLSLACHGASLLWPLRLCEVWL
jgi:hypothetical protein